ncbi:MAG: hypothetical protein H6Q33_5012 [Deltaproteobacteria bacterium]|jgi:hypothetical protein|nr:hypothetical protein [Deltaproteobacteria bacterium]
MAKVMEGGQAVPLEDAVLAQAFQLEALMNVLERQGVLRKAEVLEETKRLKVNAPKAG